MRPSDNPSSSAVAGAAPALAYETPPDETPSERPVSRFAGRNLWALLDQVLISGTNFVTIVLVVRAVEKGAAGNFTLVHSFLLLLNTLQISLIIHPLNVLSATLRGKDYRSFATSMAVGQGALALGLGAVAALVAAVTLALHQSAAPLLVALVPAVVAWQLQEFVRRVLYAEDRLRAAFFNDMVCYGGQLVLMTAAFIVGVRRGGPPMLSGEMALYIIAVTSALAAMVGVVRIWPSLRGTFDVAIWKRAWTFGRWLTASEALTYASSVHANQYIVWLALHSSAAAGALRIVQQIFGPMRVMSFFLGNVLPIQFSRTLANDGDAALHRRLRRIALVVVPILAGYCLFVCVAADPILKLLFPKFADEGSLLRLFSIGATLGYAAMLLQAALMAHQKTHAIFVTSVCSAVLTLALGWPLAKWLHAEGGAVNLILASLLMTFMLARAYWRRQREPSACGEPAAMEAQEVL